MNPGDRASYARAVMAAYLNGYGHGGGLDANALRSWGQTSTDRIRLIAAVGRDVVESVEEEVETRRLVGRDPSFATLDAIMRRPVMDGTILLDDSPEPLLDSAPGLDLFPGVPLVVDPNMTEEDGRGW